MTHSLFGNALLQMTQLCITMMTLADDNDGTHVMAQCSCLKGHSLDEGQQRHEATPDVA